jgi:hypothetical protein
MAHWMQPYHISKLFDIENRTLCLPVTVLFPSVYNFVIIVALNERNVEQRCPKRSNLRISNKYGSLTRNKFLMKSVTTLK